MTNNTISLDIRILAESIHLIFESLLNKKAMDIGEVITLNRCIKDMLKEDDDE